MKRRHYWLHANGAMTGQLHGGWRRPRVIQTNIVRERRWPALLVLATFGVILNLVLFSGAFYYLVLPPNPKDVFERATGFNWPSNARIISTRNEGLMSDGEFHLVFSVDDVTVAHWLRIQPTAPLPNWQSEPVPTEIGFHCKLTVPFMGGTYIRELNYGWFFLKRGEYGGLGLYGELPEMPRLLSTAR